jgi:hypothetical protein
VSATDVIGKSPGQLGALVAVKDARIAELEAQLAEADSLIAAQRYTIDPNPPSRWPPGSILRAACARHDARNSRT